MKNRFSLGYTLALLLAFFANVALLSAQHVSGSGVLLHRLHKLQNRASILYVAAHPDDENTRLIAYMANEWNAEVTYVSLTRGDGGQNLIGPELREELGLIRTHELLAARSIDGGQQRFSRANDFGYSKHHDETFAIWNKESVLSDVVRLVRQLQPHIIITRFDSTGGHTHGHHSASAKLALEAFEQAADPTAFPEHHLAPWKAASIYWNAYSWRGVSEDILNHPKLIKLDVGGKHPLSGHAYSELAALSRTQHKSQGFGSSPAYGSQFEYLIPWSNPLSMQEFSSLAQRTWAKDAQLRTYDPLLSKIIEGFDALHPQKSANALLTLKELILKDNTLDEAKKIALQQEIDRWVADALGLTFHFEAMQASFIEGEALPTELRITAFEHEIAEKVALLDVSVEGNSVGIEQTKLDENRRAVFQHQLEPTGTAFEQSPYWLQQAGTLGLYTVNDATLIGKAMNAPLAQASFSLQYEGHTFRVHRDLEYVSNDPVRGRMVAPVLWLPALEIKPLNEQLMVGTNETAWVEVDLIKHAEQPLEIKVDMVAEGLQLPVESSRVLALPAGKYSERIRFALSATDFQQDVAKISFEAQTVNRNRNQSYAHSIRTIEYEHLPTLRWFKPAELRCIRLQVERSAEKVLYIQGAGDLVPEGLRAMGFEVNEAGAEAASELDFSAYEAIVVGIRAYNVATEAMLQLQPKLEDFMRQGGTVVVQYNTLSRDLPEQIGPYPLRISRNRVTDETSPVVFIDAEHPVLNTPNAIGLADFDGWVQERGLYFPSEWDARFNPILSLQDPKEEPVRGALLVAKVGKGHFVYTGLSFFRELPAGVPGAYRLMANILSLSGGGNE